MEPGKILRAVVLPLVEFSVLFPLLMFWAIMYVGTTRGPLGLLILILALPATFRYVMIILESCAKGEVPGAFDAEYFNWTGNLWSLFPLPVAIALLWFGGSAYQLFGNVGAIVVLAIAAAFLPASLAVLAITHSPQQSLNPIAISRLLKSAGESFWIASVYLLVAGWAAIQAEQLSNIAGNFIQLYVLFSFAAVTGTLIQPFGLVDDVSIPEPLAATEQEHYRELELSRSKTLTHAYGLVSCGNRDGGFRHVINYIAKDSDPVSAWAWFFEHMFRWEEKQHALFFAQHYIHDMLRHGEKIPALKLIIRCRMINESFKPFKDDIPAAIAAADSSGNIELAAVLKRV